MILMAAIAALLPVGPASADQADYGVAAYEPATAHWLLHGPGAEFPGADFYFGDPDAAPLLGDWDCDGVDTVGTFRRGKFALRDSNDAGPPDHSFFFGAPGDVGVAGDWDGDGCDTVGVFRPSSGRVMLSDSLTTAPASDGYFFGIAGDRPFAGDFDGDGIDTIGLYRNTSGLVYLTNRHATGIAEIDFFYGVPSDRFVVADWDGDGVDSVGVVRPATSSAFLRNSNDLGFADVQFEFADADLELVAGSFPAPPAGQRDLRRIFPWRRVIAYYGNHLVPAMGVLGETGPAQAVGRVNAAAAPYATDDKPVVGAFELIVSVAQASAGSDGDYSRPTPIDQIRPWLEAARANGMLLILDIQPGRTSFVDEVKRYEEILKEPEVGLALDPEWRMGPGQVPGRVIGSVDASEVNAVSQWLSDLVIGNDLPQKLFVVHQFKSTMITNRDQLVPRPGLAWVLHMDGFGSQQLKLQTYSFVQVERPFFNGFKLFYDEDTNIFQPGEILLLDPVPDLVTYQ
jgi:hypothetical protein